ncbi:MAG: hypothetical protein KC492_05080, partial [Myxococcales bacterium]|nr:hypothetical protein [Myxococcales bacterium]
MSWLLLLALCALAYVAGWANAKPSPAASNAKSAEAKTDRLQAEHVHGLAPLPGDAVVPQKDRPPGSVKGDG